jgi:hypothetical protein
MGRMPPLFYTLSFLLGDADVGYRSGNGLLTSSAAAMKAFTNHPIDVPALHPSFVTRSSALKCV